MSDTTATDVRGGSWKLPSQKATGVEHPRSSCFGLVVMMVVSLSHAACSKTCDFTSECEQGNYCSAERFCTRDCAKDFDCRSGCKCTEYGECIDEQTRQRCTEALASPGEPDASTPDDAGTNSNGGFR